MDIQLIGKLVAPISLCLIMFSMGTSLKVADFLQLSKQPLTLCAGLSTQVIVPPLIALLLIFTLNINPTIAIGLIILAACPGGPGTNLLTFMCGGDVPLSLAMSFACSIVIGITIPVVITAFTALSSSTPVTISGLGLVIAAMQILALTVIPTIGGMAIRFYKPTLAASLETKTKNGGLALLLFAVAIICYDVWPQLLKQGAKTSVAIVALCGICIIVSYCLSKLCGFNKAQTRTISIGTGFQNAALAFTVCTVLVNTPESAIPAALYTPLTIPISILLVLSLRRSPARINNQ